jgi:hypothetical protein
MKTKRAPQAPTHPQPLTPTDEEILRTMHTYRYMTALDVAYSLFSPNSLSHVRRILALLSGGKDYQERQFLYRFPLPSAKAGNRERIYTLGAAGREVVESSGIPVDWYYRPSKTGRLSHSHLAHQLLVTRFVAATCSWASKQSEYSLADVRLSYELEKGVAMLEERYDRASAAVIPDGWLLVERVSDGVRFPMLLEIDRGSEYQERFKQHVRGRLEFIRSGDYAEVFHTPAVMIAYATTGPIAEQRDRRVKTMAAWTRDVLAELSLDDWAGVFRFTAVTYETLYTEVQALFTEPVWYRPDAPTPVPLLAA